MLTSSLLVFTLVNAALVALVNDLGWFEPKAFDLSFLVECGSETLELL